MPYPIDNLYRLCYNRTYLIENVPLKWFFMKGEETLMKRNGKIAMTIILALILSAELVIIFILRCTSTKLTDAATAPHPITDTAVFTPPVANEETYIDPETGEPKTYTVVIGNSSSRLVYGGRGSGIGVCNMSNGCRYRLVAPFNFPNLDKAYAENLAKELSRNGIDAQIKSYDPELGGWLIEIRSSDPDKVSNRDISAIAYTVAVR